MENRELYQIAEKARAHAYAPYSGFRVGAALLAADGTVYEGANMENGSYGATVCAERVALVKALYDGHRNFAKIAVAGSADGAAWPCGICRQSIFEFGADVVVVAGRDVEHLEAYTIGQLMPKGFRL